jgi:hypothetical protein
MVVIYGCGGVPSVITLVGFMARMSGGEESVGDRRWDQEGLLKDRNNKRWTVRERDVRYDVGD